MNRRTLIAGGVALFLAGCSGQWQVAYEEPANPAEAKNWKLDGVVVAVPSRLSVSNSNTYAPNADIVWHGEPFGDRRAQVAAIVDQGITRGARELKGNRPVTIAATVQNFHSVTPAAVARAPGAVHNISYIIQVLDTRTGEALTERQLVQADLEAYVGAAAISSAIQGGTQKARIISHLARVTRGWLGFGPDQRRTFAGVGR